jgi:hypothetical protein
MTVPLRAALYLRVSTARQAEHDVSIPDQKRQGEAYCLSRAYQLVERKSKKLKPVSEVIAVAVPPLIDQATSDAVQAHLRARNPRVTLARVVSGPTLLTGICLCADCGGAMTLRTGKEGRYRYYTGSIKARQAGRVAKAARSRWRSWTDWSPNTSQIDCFSRRGSRRSWHRFLTAVRSERSAAVCTSPN